VLDLDADGSPPLNSDVYDFISRAGHGHTVNYLDHLRVMLLSLIYTELRRAASAAGYSEDVGTLLILPFSAEDISTILSSLPVLHPPIDTLISMRHRFPSMTMIKRRIASSPSGP
jgi:hypothetical protein